MIKITTLIINLFTHITRRGQGLFKLLFTIDDFFRLFAMTLLIPIFFSAIGLNDTFRVLGVILGLVIEEKMHCS